MDDTQKRMIPQWVWALMAVILVALTLVLFMTDRQHEPGPALVYDVSEYEAVDAEFVQYREVKRIPLALERPSGFASGNDGSLVVVGDSTLLTLDEGGREQARHELDGQPQCVAVARDGVVYLGMRDHVAVFAGDAKGITRWASLGDRTWLASIAVDDRHVFVADAGNKRVLRYNRSGELLNQIGGRPEDRDAPVFVVPSRYFEVLLDGMGALWITNPGKLGVEKYRPDGELLSLWHQPGMALDRFPGCCNPIHAAFKSDGSLVTAEKGINRIKTFNADRSFAGVVATPETLNAGWNVADWSPDMAPIRDLTVDGADRILALHGPLRAVLIFEAMSQGEEIQ